MECVECMCVECVCVECVCVLCVFHKKMAHGV